MPSASQKPGQKPALFPNLSPASSPKTGSKRKLKDEDEDEPAVPERRRKTFRTYAEHQKHGTHYYLDGNILLQVGKTRFKVHRSRLASESSWFQMLVDHYNGAMPEGKTVDDDVEDIVNEADNVGDDPLFFLDAAEGEEVPTADEFAALLTAMYSGIDYVFTPPSIDDVCLMYRAAWYYGVTKYYHVAHKFLESFFPEFDKIVKEPSLHNAVQLICMGDKLDVEELLPRALHDLARASTSALEDCLPSAATEDKAGVPAETSTATSTAPISASAALNTNGQTDGDPQIAEVGGQQNDAASDDDEASESDVQSDEDTDIIKKINSTHYTRVLILQRHLSSAWDSIVKELINITCSKACGFAPRFFAVFNAVTEIRLKYPSDPLLGIQELLRSSVLQGNYCIHMKATINTRLVTRKAQICKNLEETWTK